MNYGALLQYGFNGDVALETSKEKSEIFERFMLTSKVCQKNKIFERVLLLLSISAILPRSALSIESAEDQFRVESLVCRNNKQLLATAQDLPDEILPVCVKDEGNTNDPDTNLGMVIHEYSISQTEVTARQYCTYLNQVATGENFELFYNEKMGADKNVASIRRAVVNGKNVYTIIVDKQRDRGNFPIVYVNLYQAARFCNWLQNQSKPGLTGDDLTERGAYTLDGKSSGPIARNPDAVWFIPTESEWYKPAYYKGGGLHAGYWNFGNRSDYAPSSSLSSKENGANYYPSSYIKEGPPYLTPVQQFQNSVGTYNTYDMSGNVAEWVATEENQGTVPLRYVARGGSWKSLYYGAGFEKKCNVANWGVELSKWSRPGYDPAQGYDNVGFRVATSLIVNSAPPRTAAPGVTELTPTEIIELPAMILFGVGTIFSGKKMMEYRQNAEAPRATSELQQNRMVHLDREKEKDQQQRENSDLPRNKERASEIQESPNEILEKAISREKLETPSSGANFFSTRKALSITQKQKAEIEKEIGGIDQLFLDATNEYKAIKQFLGSGDRVDSQGLQYLKEKCDGYDVYAVGLTKTVNKIQEAFPEARELWIPWCTAAMEAWIQAMMLRHEVVSKYYEHDVFQKEKEREWKSQAVQMRKESNQKTLGVICMIESYKKILEALAQEGEESSPETSFLAVALEILKGKLVLLEKIKAEIIKHEPQEETLCPTQVKTQIVNRAYLAYARESTDNNQNLYRLYYGVFYRNNQFDPENLVNALEMQRQFKKFLREKNVTELQEKKEEQLMPDQEDNN